MSREKRWTPGPWKWIQQVPSMGWALVTDDPEHHGVIAECMGNGIWFPNGGGQYDAYLIASAPDLLEALEETVEWDSHDSTGVPAVCLEKANAAIAKAYGETE